MPPNLQRFPPLDRVRLLQEFISSFSYNHTPHTYASVEKNKPFGRIVAAANTVIQMALPIRCIEVCIAETEFGIKVVCFRLPSNSVSVAGLVEAKSSLRTTIIVRTCTQATTSSFNCVCPEPLLQAVFVGLALSCGWEGFDRYPVGFKTWVEGHVYRHIILIIHHRPSGKFGAVGLSR